MHTLTMPSRAICAVVLVAWPAKRGRTARKNRMILGFVRLTDRPRSYHRPAATSPIADILRAWRTVVTDSQSRYAAPSSFRPVSKSG